jgi:hypothetical protein
MSARGVQTQVTEQDDGTGRKKTLVSVWFMCGVLPTRRSPVPA